MKKNLTIDARTQVANYAIDWEDGLWVLWRQENMSGWHRLAVLQYYSDAEVLMNIWTDRDNGSRYDV